MTYDTVWSVTWYSTGQYDLRFYTKYLITQPPGNISTFKTTNKCIHETVANIKVESEMTSLIYKINFKLMI